MPNNVYNYLIECIPLIFNYNCMTVYCILTLWNYSRIPTVQERHPKAYQSAPCCLFLVTFFMLWIVLHSLFIRWVCVGLFSTCSTGKQGNLPNSAYPDSQSASHLDRQSGPTYDLLSDYRGTDLSYNWYQIINLNLQNRLLFWARVSPD